MMATQVEVNRRAFLKAGASGSAALVLGFYLPAWGRAQASAAESGSKIFKPSAWVRITPDNQVTLLVEQPEMGQGPRTAVPMMLAEELEADWTTIRVEQAPTIPEIYKNLITGGSGCVRSAWGSARKVGAQAREMLITAAAKKWGVDKSECRAENGHVIYIPTGRRLSYGELVEAASKLDPIPADGLPLKDPKKFRYIGEPIPRTDIPSKVDGSATFGIDIRVPGTLYAVIARCPYFGGKLKTCDDSAAKALPGVRAVFPVAPLSGPDGKGGGTAGGVAVVGDSTWAALQGRKALKLTWDKGPAGNESTDSLRKRFDEQLAGPPSFVAVNQGDALQALQSASKKIEAVYETPFQAHATMEPMNTTVAVRDDGIEVWSPTQGATLTQEDIVRVSGLPAGKVTIHMTLSGGSFGRRGQWDYQAEAWQVSNEVKRPVQLLWSRDDDLQHDFYRQYAYQRLSAALDEHGGIAAWSQRIASTSVHAYYAIPDRAKDPRYIAGLELGGADVLPYFVPNFRLDYVAVDSVVPRAWWRSVTNFTAFAMESFVDELAHAAGRDPYEFRMRLLPEDQKVTSVMWPDGKPLDTRKFRNVLQLAADKADWGKPLPAGWGRGIACHFSFGSYIAHVAEVSAEKDGSLRVRRVVSAVDCGTAVNPDGVRAMTEGAINFALTEALTGEITIKDGAVEQSNFHDYQVLRMNQSPDIEVYIVSSSEGPEGMGEPGVPPLAPAVTNAVFAATGVRVRRLPIDARLLRKL
ncbi:MAG TPA: xanthine dehydrogenase family protein molybdopterin-binding subunit [Candidatus Bathyarchaeia archaeon]|nr:xanthine dehydrogenase family protein molybdopterin-binding subunit [Candidatus Bathyarchaeia archaeon]